MPYKTGNPNHDVALGVALSTLQGALAAAANQAAANTAVQNFAKSALSSAVTNNVNASFAEFLLMQTGTRV